MKFGMNPSPYYRSKRSTSQIMVELFIALCFVWLCGIVYYFTQSVSNGVASIVCPFVAMCVALVTEALFMLPKHINENGTFKGLIQKLLCSYGYITGLILGLLLPVGTSIYVVIVSTIFAIGVGKMVFGGFGYNIFNPAILGRIFAQTTFLSQMKYDVDSSLAISTGATVTSMLGQNGWSIEALEVSNYSLIDILLGNYRGTIGETFTLVILIIGVILMIRKVIDWRVPTFYLGTLFVSFLLMGLFGGYGIDSFEYALIQLSVGGIVFGAIFCLTDPVTSPTSQVGRVIFAIGSAFISLLIRYLGNTPEGVAYSILIMNALTPLIDSSIKGLSSQFTRKKVVTTCVMGAITLTTGSVIGLNEVRKADFLNLESKVINSKTYSLNSVVKRVSSSNDLIVYNCFVEGILNENEKANLGSVRDFFSLEEYDIYFSDSEKYSDAKFKVSNNKLVISVRNKEKNQYETINVKLNGNDLVLDVTKEGGYYYLANKNTGYSVEEYNGVKSVSIKDNELVLEFSDDHSSSDEKSKSFISCEFNITINYRDRLVVSSEFISTGGTINWGKTLLGNGDLSKFIDENGDYSDSGESDSYSSYLGYLGGSVTASKDFYDKYVKLSSPISFDEVMKTKISGFSKTDIEEIKNGEGMTIVSGITYSSLGYVTLLQRVVEYALADNMVGKVGS